MASVLSEQAAPATPSLRREARGRTAAAPASCWTLAHAADACSAVALACEREAPGMVKALTLEPSGAHVYAAHECGAVSKWSTRHARLEATLRGHNGVVTCLLFHDGALWSGGADRRLLCWRSDVCARVLRGHYAAIKALYSSGSAQHIWSLGEDRYLRCWRCSDGAQLVLVRSEEFSIQCASFGGAAYTATGEASCVNVYNTTTGTRMAALQARLPSVCATLRSLR